MRISRPTASTRRACATVIFSMISSLPDRVAGRHSPSGLRCRFHPPRAEDVDLPEDGLSLPAVLGGGQAGLQLQHLGLAVITPLQLTLAFDHRSCPERLRFPSSAGEGHSYTPAP